VRDGCSVGSARVEIGRGLVIGDWRHLLLYRRNAEEIYHFQSFICDGDTLSCRGHVFWRMTW
jgi:hypothetical protein